MKTSSNSLTKPISYDNTEIYKRFDWYGALRNETYTDKTKFLWIEEFKRLGYTQAQILERIQKTAHKKLYGATKFSDFLDEDTDFLTQEDVNNEVKRRFENLCKTLGVDIKKLAEVQSLNYYSDIYITAEKQKYEEKEKELDELIVKFKSKQYVLMHTKKELINDYGKIFQSAIDKLKDEPAEVKQRLKEIAVENLTTKTLKEEVK